MAAMVPGPTPGQTMTPPLSLHPSPSLDAATFQARWGEFAPTPGCASGPMRVALGQRAPAVLTEPRPLMTHLAARGFAALASGGPPDAKFFSPRRRTAGALPREATVNPSIRAGTATMKSDAEESGGGGGETIDRGVRVVRGVTMTCVEAPIDRDVPHSRTDASFVVVGAISSPPARVVPAGTPASRPTPRPAQT